MSNTAEELREQLETARVQLGALIAEQESMAGRLREAEQEDHAERMEAARSGGGIGAALRRVGSKVRGVKDRREELPYEIWSARIRVAELELAHYEAAAPELEERVQAARERSYEAERELREAEDRTHRLKDAYSRTFQEQTAAYHRSQEVERELAALEANGPGSYPRGG